MMALPFIVLMAVSKAIEHTVCLNVTKLNYCNDSFSVTLDASHFE